MGVTLRQNYKEGCDCVMGHRNDIAFHAVTCGWRIRRLAEQRQGLPAGSIRPESERRQPRW